MISTIWTLATVFLLLGSVVAETWFPNQDSSYEYFVSPWNQQKSWYDARAHCNNMGADLASVADENDAQLIMLQISSEYIHWIGVDKIMSDDWRFSSNNEIIPDSSARWEADYPQPDGTLQCAFIHPDSQGLWRNEQCMKNGAYVCQRQPAAVHTTKVYATTAPTSGECPEGYSGISGKCYGVFYSESRSWTEALAACEAQSGGRWQSLASFHSEAEYATVITQLDPNDDKRLWIGFYSQDEPLVNTPNWFWSDNTPRDFSKLFQIPISGEHCAYVSSNSPEHWIPGDCNQKYGMVCQTYVDGSVTIGPPTPHPSCPMGYSYYDDACYRMLEEELMWVGAEVECLKHTNSNLVSIHSVMENAAVLLLFPQAAQSAWIGMYRDNKTEEYGWSDGSGVVYTNWMSGQPLNCAYMDLHGAWYTANCTDVRLAVCKIPIGPLPTAPPTIDGECPYSTGLEWVPYGSYCYQYHKKATNWVQAGVECSLAHHDAALASVHHAGENEFVFKLYKENNPDGAYQNVWLGLYRNQDGEIHWSDGEPIQYETWLPGEPGTNGNCTAMRVNKNFGESKRWVMSPCGQINDFVCKTPMVPKYEPVTEAFGYCPDDVDWVGYGSFCYLFMPDATLSWEQSQKRCQTYSANLVTIEDSVENDFVYEAAYESQHLPIKKWYWIGLHRYHSDQPFIWVESGMEPNVTFWDETNVHYDGNRAVRASTEDGHWFSDYSDNTHGYVCKIAKSPYPVTAETPTAEVEISDTKDSGLSSGDIAGIVLGVLVLVALIIAAVIFLGPKVKDLWGEWQINRKSELVNEEL